MQNGVEKVRVIEIPETSGNSNNGSRSNSQEKEQRSYKCPKIVINSARKFRRSSQYWAKQANSEEHEDFYDKGNTNMKHLCTEKCSTTPLHEAAKEGNSEQIELLLDEDGIDPNSRDCLGRTALHYAVKADCNCDACIASGSKSVRLLVENPRSDINIQDYNGDTPLHLAAENQSQTSASILLSNGADVSIKSKSGARAVKLMVEKIPDAMDTLLNRAISIEKYDTSNPKCELKVNFGAIVGYEAKNVTRLSGKTYTYGEKVYRKETQFLSLILDASSQSRKKILTHPLIALFLYLKWRKVRPVFWAMVLFHAGLLLLYSIYILDVYVISCPYRPKITEPAAVKAAKAAGITEGFMTKENETYRAEYIKFSWFQFSPQSNLKEIQLGITECHLEIGPTVKSILLLSLTILMTFNEIFKMLPALKVYWRATNNQIQWAYFILIYLTSWPVFMEAPNITFWQYQAAACGLFIAWSMMLFQIAKFPKLGLYVEILTQVMKNFGFFMLTYASLIIAFAMAFCVLFPGNAPFSSIPLSILKVLMMMVGEVNYEDIFYGEEESTYDDMYYPIPGHILYGAFCIMITIVLMNLLVGLTVSDIQGLVKEAEITRLTRQIIEISQLESLVFSRRVQSIFPGRIGSFLRESILVVPPIKCSKDQNNGSSTPLVDACFFTFRPNDPNDTTVPENLKLLILRIADIRHRHHRMSHCKNQVSNKDPMTPGPYSSFSDEYSYPHFNPTHKTRNNSKSSLTVPTAYRQRSYVDPGCGGMSMERDSNFENWFGSTFPTRSRSTSSPPQFDFFLRRLEDKIMDRIKVQMDGLYDRLEEKLNKLK